MLTSLRIRHFKAWGDTGSIRLAPLTVIFGANSAGKSSLGQLLLALKQTVLSTDRRRTLYLGDENALIDLGSFEGVIHNHDLAKPLCFELGWRLPVPLQVPATESSPVIVGDEVRLSVELLADQRQQPVVQRLSYTLQRNGEVVLTVGYKRVDGGYELQTAPLSLPRSPDWQEALPPPEKFYRVPDQVRSRFGDTAFLADLALATETALHSVQHLGPLRDSPRRMYAWTGEAPESVGPRGEFTVPAILAASEQGRTYSSPADSKEYRFDAYIAHWLTRLDLIDSFAVRPIAKGRREYEVLIRTHPAGSEVMLTDVGFGVSQALPALTQAFYAAPHSTVWLEQPEVHLHPRVQAELADVFIDAIQVRENGQPRHTQLIVESHSEHFLNRIQRRVAEGSLAAADVAVYFCRRGEASTEIEPLRLNEFGEIENWPEHFFGDEMADIAGRTRAALIRRKQQSERKP